MKNTLKSLTISIFTFLARRAIARYAPKIVAVTGSVGKTSTKDAIYAVISSAFEARKSEKSMNGDIGIPLAILGLDNAWSSPGGWIANAWKGARVAFGDSPFPEWLVLEVGADHPGDIQKVGKWLHPDIVVLTAMADVPVHIEFFKNTEEVVREKMFLAHALNPGGILVVNSNDKLFMHASESVKAHKVTYGMSKTSDAKITETEAIYGQAPLSLPRGQYGIFEINGKKERIELDGVIGGHLMYPVAAACAVASILNIADDLPVVFAHMDLPRGRMRLLPGVSKSVIIDDTYNSSPIACEEALKTIRGISVKGKKIAVLGDMKELGSHAESAHLEMGKLAGEFVHTLVTVGQAAKDIARGALAAGLSPERIIALDTSVEAAKKLPDIVRAGDIVLIKGSQSIRMEKISEALLEDKSKAYDLLVRQEFEWRRR